MTGALGVHVVDLCRFVSGEEMVSVIAQRGRYRNTAQDKTSGQVHEIDTEDWFALMGRTESGTQVLNMLGSCVVLSLSTLTPSGLDDRQWGRHVLQAITRCHPCGHKGLCNSQSRKRESTESISVNNPTLCPGRVIYHRLPTQRAFFPQGRGPK